MSDSVLFWRQREMEHKKELRLARLRGRLEASCFYTIVFIVGMFAWLAVR